MSSTPSEPDETSSSQQAQDVGYRHAFAFGAVAALIVMVGTTIFLRAWQSIDSVISVMIFTPIAFVSVAGVTALLVWFDRRKPGGDEPPQYPILK